MLGALLALAVGIGTGAASAVEPASVPPIEFKFAWESSESPVRARLFEAGGSSANYAVGQIGTSSSLRELPLGSEVTAGSVSVPPGQYRKLFLVVENPLDQEVHFFFPPHEVRPIEKAIGHRLDCLCFGQTYFARPKTVWYRVLGIHVQTQAPGALFDVLHKLVGVDHRRVRKVVEAERSWDGAH